jgi:hypothetical protein
MIITDATADEFLISFHQENALDGAVILISTDKSAHSLMQAALSNVAAIDLATGPQIGFYVFADGLARGLLHDRGYGRYAVLSGGRLYPKEQSGSHDISAADFFSDVSLRLRADSP